MTAADQAGAYRLAGLAPGSYTITFELPGLQPLTRELRVRPGRGRG